MQMVSETNSNNNTRRYWLFFLVSLVVMIALLIFANEWFWVALPFVLTYLVLALDKM